MAKLKERRTYRHTHYTRFLLVYKNLNLHKFNTFFFLLSHFSVDLLSLSLSEKCVGSRFWRFCFCYPSAPKLLFTTTEGRNSPPKVTPLSSMEAAKEFTLLPPTSPTLIRRQIPTLTYGYFHFTLQFRIWVFLKHSPLSFLFIVHCISLCDLARFRIVSCLFVWKMLLTRLGGLSNFCIQLSV